MLKINGLLYLNVQRHMAALGIQSTCFCRRYMAALVLNGLRQPDRDAGNLARYPLSTKNTILSHSNPYPTLPFPCPNRPCVALTVIYATWMCYRKHCTLHPSHRLDNPITHHLSHHPIPTYTFLADHTLTRRCADMLVLNDACLCCRNPCTLPPPQPTFSSHPTPSLTLPPIPH